MGFAKFLVLLPFYIIGIIVVAVLLSCIGEWLPGLIGLYIFYRICKFFSEKFDKSCRKW